LKKGPRLVTKDDQRADAKRSPARNRLNLADLAYDRIEDLIVACELRPGMLLSLQDLQQMTGIGRTPIHQAVNKLAADTLIIVRPRHGLQIAPIDLARERMLLQLRRDLERFVVRLAAQRANASHRNQLLHSIRILRDRGQTMDIGEFNRLDRRMDQLLNVAAGEPFLEHTLRPLHTLSRRIGWIFHTWAAPDEGLSKTTNCHLEILEAVAKQRAREAISAADRLIDFCDSMFDTIERVVDPARLDCNLEFIHTS
jgi:DNA-binding GntR family transcriptional regulator